TGMSRPLAAAACHASSIWSSRSASVMGSTWGRSARHQESGVRQVTNFFVQPQAGLGPQTADLAVADLEQLGNPSLGPAVVEGESEDPALLGGQPLDCLLQSCPPVQPGVTGSRGVRGPLGQSTDRAAAVAAGQVEQFPPELLGRQPVIVPDRGWRRLPK